MLVLGPPRSGKTSGLVVPTVLAADGPVVSTSTKPDVLTATARARAGVGECLLFDPSGTVPDVAGVRRIRWSPVTACRQWDDALLVARALVSAARGAGRDVSTTDHWQERAEALLAPLLHAAALDGRSTRELLSWVDRRQPAPAMTVLDAAGDRAGIAADLLAGIAATDEREQSGIWSTASGALGAYRSTATLESTQAPDFDASAFCASADTLYVCASGRHQAHMAPLVVGLLTEIRSSAYARHADGQSAVPMVLALDEVANIAPIPELPALVSEGGGQGVLTMACLQDLSQARVRWGAAADGFLSLFGTTVVMPGIGDMQTLEALSALGGDTEVPVLSRSQPAVPPLGGPVTGALWPAVAGRVGRAAPVPTVTVSTRRQRRLAVDDVGRGRPGMALVVDHRNSMGWVKLTPWFAHEPWRTMASGQERAVPSAVPALPGPSERQGSRDHGREPGRPLQGPDLGR